jgi:hypothetical protein
VPIADDGDNRCRDQWSHAFDGGDASAVRSFLECDVNPAVSNVDLLVQLRQILIEALKELPAKACQLVPGIFQDGRQAAAYLPRMLRQYDTVLGKQGRGSG